ncbi:hypothetical protein B0O99DRAFT_692044 [Bisporella sp. PMI_857]|nr:hypothetical protein B0O99DRAFT_692044 [Bisporella sp. PMI_857]
MATLLLPETPQRGRSRFSKALPTPPTNFDNKDNQELIGTRIYSPLPPLPIPKMATAVISRRPVPDGRTAHAATASIASVSSVYSDSPGFSRSLSESSQGTKDTPSGIDSETAITPKLPPKDTPRQSPSDLSNILAPGFQPSPPRTELWRRRSVKSEKAIAFPELKLQNSNGSTASPPRKELPTIPTELPRSLGGRKPVPIRKAPPQPDTMGMGNKLSKKLEEKVAKLKDNVKKSPRSPWSSKESPTVVQPSSGRLPTPEYQKTDGHQPPTPNILSPISPETPPNDVPPQIPSKSESRILANGSLLPNQATFSLRSNSSAPTVNAASVETSNLIPLPMLEANEPLTITSEAPVMRSPQPKKAFPTKILTPEPSPSPIKTTTPSYHDRSPSAMPFPTVAVPAAAGTIFPGLPLDVTHFRCFTSHSNMRRTKNVCCPVALSFASSSFAKRLGVGPNIPIITIEAMLGDPSPTSGVSPNRALNGEENAQFRHQPPTHRFSTPATEPPSPGIKRSSTDAPHTSARRRSSTFSDYSLNEARRTFRSSTDDLLLPKPSATVHELGHDSSAWHSSPIALALLPAVGGMLFKNGSAVITDIMLLGLAAIFLNWSVRLPWSAQSPTPPALQAPIKAAKDWYHSAQAIRQKEEYNGDTIIAEDSDNEHTMSVSQTLKEVPEDGTTSNPAPKPLHRLPALEAAAKELYGHEVLALLSCFIFPVLGAYLLHTIRSQLSRPSETLISNYNLTIFFLASELRPIAHLVKLVRSRTLHLQRIVNSNPYNHAEEKVGDIRDLARRIADLEARNSTNENAASNPTEAGLNGKQSAILITEAKRSLQPDLDALNRAVRRYEKRATLQTFQTESRLLDLEARLNDAISLAAAAANNGQRQRGFTGIIVEWIAAAIVLPVHALRAVATLPVKTIAVLINYGKLSMVGRKQHNGRKAVIGKYSSHRVGDRVQGRVVKR